jgi:hypothetical protein
MIVQKLRPGWLAFLAAALLLALWLGLRGGRETPPEPGISIVGELHQSEPSPLTTRIEAAPRKLLGRLVTVRSAVDSSPLEGARLWRIEEPEQRRILAVDPDYVTGADGSVAIADEDTRFQVGRPGYESVVVSPTAEQAEVQLDPVEPTTLVCVDGTGAPASDVLLVVYPDDGGPLASALGHTREGEGVAGSNSPLWARRTDEHGRAVFDTLPAGVYDVEAAVDGHCMVSGSEFVAPGEARVRLFALHGLVVAPPPGRQIVHCRFKLTGIEQMNSCASAQRAPTIQSLEERFPGARADVGLPLQDALAEVVALLDDGVIARASWGLSSIEEIEEPIYLIPGRTCRCGRDPGRCLAAVGRAARHPGVPRRRRAPLAVPAARGRRASRSLCRPVDTSEARRATEASSASRSMRRSWSRTGSASCTRFGLEEPLVPMVVSCRFADGRSWDCYVHVGFTHSNGWSGASANWRGDPATKVLWLPPGRVRVDAVSGHYRAEQTVELERSRVPVDLVLHRE